MALAIRPETAEDRFAIRAVHEAAFESTLEADIVDSVRDDCDTVLSLVAQQQGEIIGHILFSAVTVTGYPGARFMGLGPMAVIPDEQRKGAGSALVKAGLEACRQSGVEALVVLGHPDFYPRFGFEPASRYGMTCQFDVPDEAFMVIALTSGALGGRAGKVVYHEAFSGA